LITKTFLGNLLPELQLVQLGFLVFMHFNAECGNIRVGLILFIMHTVFFCVVVCVKERLYGNDLGFVILIVLLAYGGEFTD
jgi:hypothetical protein